MDLVRPMIDYLDVTEIANDRVSSEQVERLRRRYLWARPYCVGRDVHELAALLAMAETPRSLDAALDRSEEEHTLGDSMADELAIDPTGVTQNHEVERLLDNWIDALSNREKEVLEGRFGLHDRDPETLEVLSDRLGLTRERVRQIQNEALVKLRRHMVRNGISKEALL